MLRSVNKYMSFFSVLKRIGGRWMDYPYLNKQVDGDKFVCFDHLISTHNTDRECIIYSFGISDDWTFEDHMDGLGMKLILIQIFNVNL